MGSTLWTPTYQGWSSCYHHWLSNMPARETKFQPWYSTIHFGDPTTWWKIEELDPFSPGKDNSLSTLGYTPILGLFRTFPLLPAGPLRAPSIWELVVHQHEISCNIARVHFTEKEVGSENVTVESTGHITYCSSQMMPAWKRIKMSCSRQSWSGSSRPIHYDDSYPSSRLHYIHWIRVVIW